jgi:hypothetical protein
MINRLEEIVSKDLKSQKSKNSQQELDKEGIKEEKTMQTNKKKPKKKGRKIKL